MNYYIQGNKEKADQIKAAFDAKAIYNNLNFANENYLYYSCDGKVAFCFIGGGLANIIKTHPDYKELELPVEPKFKVGSWITNGKYTRYIVGINNKWYVFDDGMSKYWNDVDKRYHLWTIADANDGDVLTTDNGWTCIFKAFDGCVFSSYCFMDSQKWFCEFGSEAHTLDSRINGNIHPATQRQRNILFKKMQEAGYQWYAGKKELRKVKFHYDIANFYAGMPVLVRDNNEEEWRHTAFSHMTSRFYENKFAAGCTYWCQCIPFNDDTKHLLGTTDMCPEEYINW